MIKICPTCSGVDIDGLKKAYPEETIRVGCTAHCKIYPDRVYGFVDNEVVFADYNKEFFDKVKVILENK